MNKTRFSLSLGELNVSTYMYTRLVISQPNKFKTFIYCLLFLLNIILFSWSLNMTVSYKCNHIMQKLGHEKFTQKGFQLHEDIILLVQPPTSARPLWIRTNGIVYFPLFLQ